MIQLEHLSKEYHGVRAVDDLTIAIPDGEIFGLLGPNGAGKSTAILMLVGLIEPTAGRCLVNGLDVARDPITVKQQIGYMPEDVGFYPTLSAEENLTYFGRLYGMDSRTCAKRCSDLLPLVGLEGVTKHVSGYSKGMRQRLGLAKALLNEPSVIILDEPTANLDPQGVADYRRIIRDVAREGKTVIVSSHILEEVSRVSTSIGILSAGKLVAQGSWQDLARDLSDRSASQITIRVETLDPIPEFHHTDLISMNYDHDRCTAVLIARSDIRDDLAGHLAQNGVRLRGLSREGLSLEETFLSYYRMAE
ncbi:ABC transporter ATP-binding protein [Methanosphaerula palustris]|uniref:ABC transporter related n=1 Tax=Methanosphaerula palustris (strain ATCC BAA-1556 / DSM 19958 / E1-9c) TaxID=521011 RepID=B8GG46_METPE|nr:ABC transporter ATP-binding protein [Methanosphaerula palustris]ACL16120.1 ABC transporter related [Methanosphaerula palustris E1-9c]